MAGQYCGGEEKEQKVVSMCGLHIFEQGLPERPFSHALDRSVSGYNCRPSSNEIFGLLSREPLNTIGFG